MKRETTRRLRDAYSACLAIASFTEGQDRSDYQQSLLLQSAVERHLEIVGEALNLAVAENPTLFAVIPTLRAFVGLRHRIAHGYDVVDDEIVWDTVRVDIPDLAKPIDAIL
jgi:uncharacterized protein with HEPN domain